MSAGNSSPDHLNSRELKPFLVSLKGSSYCELTVVCDSIRCIVSSDEGSGIRLSDLYTGHHCSIKYMTRLLFALYRARDSLPCISHIVPVANMQYAD